MAAAHSMDLRTRVLKDADAGLSSKELAQRYHVSRAWVDALKQRRRETGTAAPREANEISGTCARGPGGATGHASGGAAGCHARRITRGAAHSRRVEHDLACVGSVGVDRQKKPSTPTNNAVRTSPLSAVAGGTGCRFGTLRHNVFLDECGVTTDLLRRYGRSLRGTWLRDHTPCGHWQTQTVIAALRLDA